MVPAFASADATISRSQNTGVITISPQDSGTGQGAGSAVDSRVNVVITQSGGNLVFTEHAYDDPSQNTPQLTASGSGSGACTNIPGGSGVTCPTSAIDVSGTINDWAAVNGISATLSGGNPIGGPDLNDIGLGNVIDAHTISTPVTINYSATGALPLVFHGGSGADDVDGSPGKDLIEGNGGNDTINGGAGDDHLVPGAGQDNVQGGAGNDYVGIQADNGSGTDVDTYDCGTFASNNDGSSNDIVGRDEVDPWGPSAADDHDCPKMAPHFSDGNSGTDDDLKPGNFDFGSATVTAGGLFSASSFTIAPPTLGGPPNAFQMYWYVCDTANLLTNPNPGDVDDLDPGEAVRGSELPSSDSRLGGYIRSDCTLLNSGSPGIASDSITVPADAKGKYLAAIGTMGLTTTAGDIPWAAFAWDSYGITWTPKRIPYPDTDGDGFTDEVDKFPSNPLEWADSDNDGHGDNYPADPAGDRFPGDPLEWADSDNDGVGDNSDNCKLVANPDQHDSDGNHIGDACDIDTDGDGVIDSLDAFPNDKSEWIDTDGDGHGDNSDAFPNDKTEWADANHNGIGDNADAAKAAADKAAADAAAAAAAAQQQAAASLTPLVTPSTHTTVIVKKPSNKFTLKKTKVTFKGTAGSVKVTTTANGRFTVKQSGLLAKSNRYVASFTKATSKKAAALRFSLTKAGKTQLKRKGKLSVRMTLTFKPTGGTASSPRTLTVVFQQGK